MAINQTEADLELPAELKEYNYWIGLAQALERLKQNPDFQKLILEGYFKDKAVNGVSLLAAPNIKREGLRPEIMESLVAISHLQDYFIYVAAKGYVPTEEELAEDDDEIDTTI